MFGNREHKILITGQMGAGKTTAIAAISDIEPIRTEAINTTPDLVAKLTTTVGLDYGEIHLDSGERVRLYGTPGQSRFAALWSILAHGSIGALILLDHSVPDATEHLDAFLGAFSRLIEETGAVIAVTHTDLASDVSFDRYYELLEKRGMVLPILPMDPRNREEVLGAIDALFGLIEANWLEG